LRVIHGGAVERAVKEMFAGQVQLVLPILSLVSEARAHIEDVLGEINPRPRDCRPRWWRG